MTYEEKVDYESRIGKAEEVWKKIEGWGRELINCYVESVTQLRFKI